MKALHSSTYIYLFIMLFIFTSCGSRDAVTSQKMIQKRKYRSGFYVDINKKNASKTPKHWTKSLKINSIKEHLISATIKDIPDMVISLSENKAAFNQGREKSVPDSTKKLSRKEFQIAKTRAKQDNKLVRKGLMHPADQYGYSEFDQANRKPEPNGVIGAILSLSGIALLFLGSLFLSLLIGIVALVFAFISLKKYKNHPGVYKWKILAYTPFIMLLLFILFARFIL